MAFPIAQYSFVSWLRQGVATSIEQADDLGENPNAGAPGRASVTVDVTLGYVPKGGGTTAALPQVSKKVELLGPSDLGGINAQAILRTEPYDNAVNVTPGELAYVEFYEEDFPWRYTPARPASLTEDAARQHKLRPWIALFVLRASEFTLLEKPGELPVLTLTAEAELPPVDETWAWAHAQISRAVADPNDVARAIADNPDHALSRLLNPRRLVADTAYDAFIVPAFESGRLAGLRLPVDAVPAQKPSWGTAEAQADPRYPVYYHWNFKTGNSGDFETLVRKIVPGPVGERFGKRRMDISAAGYGVATDPGAAVDLEGALKPPDFVRQNFPAQPGAAVVTQIEEIVDLSENLQDANAHNLPHPFASNGNGSSGFNPILRPDGVAEDLPDDPIVTPPAYGRWHADVARVADASGNAALAWLRELNLDPRNRAVAGLGSEVVRQNQDELMERAWNQVGELGAANQRLREAELAIAAAERLFQKHVAAAGDDRVLTLTVAAQRGLSASAHQSVRELVSESRVPVAAQTSSFKRVTRPQRKIMRRLTGKSNVEGFQNNLLTKMNLESDQALSAAPPKAEPGASIGVDLVTTAVEASVNEFVIQAPVPRQLFVTLFYEDLRSRRLANPPQDLATLSLATVKAATQAALNARIPPGSPPDQLALAQRAGQMIAATSAFAADGPDAVRLTLPKALFDAEFGVQIAGKTYRGVTVVSDAPPADGEIARMTDVDATRQYQTDLQQFRANVLTGRPLPPPRPQLTSVPTLALNVLQQMRPDRAAVKRIASVLPGVGEIITGRDAELPRRTRAVMAHPIFPDPMFEHLSKLSQDFILPNANDLPKDTITLMEPNQRFIEAYLAGLNDAMASELLWREYPTDLRGTYFRVFWDTKDALGGQDRMDIKPMDQWTNQLGNQLVIPPETLVLVVRGELLIKYPDTVIYAQEADWTDNDPLKARRLKPNGQVKFPSFHARLEPDVTIVGFDLPKATALGHRPLDVTDPEPARPGWFFILKERPGQVRFGLDQSAPAGGLAAWNDLSWEAIQFPANTTYLHLSENAALQPQTPSEAQWGRTAADMAYILFQTPILYARHAEEMLP
ncbi:MAG: hypothetical protein LC794_11475 [Acidobacteria bacterium]|nr:hypothetical protein [Acidobacteriota bacterium]MCA1627287.1 hypothetical protein [Acidobacteriota bacterium]